MISRTSRFAALFAGLFLAFSMVAVDHAEARRGGSFGSRGMRTFQSAPPTRTAPAPTAPVERSMTPNTGVNTAARQPQAGPQRPGFMSGFGGTMMRGLLIGGLIGLLLGQGFGGLAGMFGFLLQAVLIGGAIMLAIRFFRSQSARGPAPALAGAGNASRFENRAAGQSDANNARSFAIPGFGGGSGGGSAAATGSDEIRLAQTDLDAFQQLLSDVQEAFGREDHAALRKTTTPEMVSYLSEELADNAKKGLRNEVSDVTLLQADIAESWREDDRDYATAALRYESRDVMRERASGKVVEGDEDHPTETTELWTFTRQNGSSWKLSAIQQA
ncbi:MULTISPECIES: Tim44 domain-containing protein [unclassified Mesorhizobium]|uniref:Tim44 domain-containing protein n=1 Tax=unclassified Mesorhizobium TaxID=325217 RepID=UPI0011274364|nr:MULTISPECIES: Tim44 domain-containing protein [unclassified Mesorhizobium]MBZ9961779.1 Tim44 domain-containing protein [Mesorhizobium sp. BR1-1-14]MBZ9982019.1 Tim44 domain-containing protein [Mesorhizobium sp. BR-1-1-8]TPI57088.1 Tim44 domain-containing protein [Mesorhizobium sp. B3-1-1]TPJ65623.1 Tim44 domain-containing protein [Mesorhizobium sp. B2-6-1]TPJ72317.1 Tim44 domain-containing protein [Mesorhizobium sp. B2-6-7]